MGLKIQNEWSEFMVVCFYVYTRWRIPFSISMSIVPPKAIGAIILSFIISEALPILLYLSWSNGNGNTPTNISHLACLKSSLPIESCNPSVIEYRFQQLYGMNQVLSVISLLQLFYQGLSIEHFNSTWACLKLSKSKPVYKLSILCHIFTLCQFITTQVIQHIYMELILILPFSWGVAMMMALVVWFVRSLSKWCKDTHKYVPFCISEVIAHQVLQ